MQTPAPSQSDSCPTARAQRVYDASNAMQLSARQWIAIAVLAVAAAAAVPALWPRVEPLPSGPDLRIAYSLSNDYWLYDRMTREAAAQGRAMLVGDSVIWGPYVTRTQTLSHALNERLGRERFANLGLDGAHPAALAGLLEHHASGLRGRTVVLAFNFLWMSSPKHDLRENEAFDFNHPGLVPQFFPRIPCYRADVSSRIGLVFERNSAFAAWTRHLQQAYFGDSTIPEWTLEHPYRSPAAPLFHRRPPDDRLRHAPEPWTKAGITPQDFPWVAAEDSFQFAQFRRALSILQRRGNRVVVLLCPFNGHMLTAASRERFTDVRTAVEAALRKDGATLLTPALLPSEEYADASHPLAAGYRRMAEDMLSRGVIP